VDLNLTEIRHEQENVVIRHISNGLSPVEWESLQTLVTDGGELSPADIATENDRHVDSVRRALNRIPDLVEREYGSVALRSRHVAELVHEAVEEAKTATRRALEAGAKAIEAAERGVTSEGEALIAWASRHGIDVDDSKDVQLFLRMEGIENVERRINEAYELWCGSGRDPHRFRSARIDLGERGLTTAWHWL
jgi:predicted transcriptional regulator